MRKRSKKRIPQDVKPWFKVKDAQLDTFALPARKTSRWVAGGRRDWDTRILSAADKHEISKILLRSFRSAAANDITLGKRLITQKLASKALLLNKTQSLAKYKNFCVISGRARTYNRPLHLARHNMRKLVGVGIISGIIK